MYNPCQECHIRYGKSYSKECDTECEYAHIVSEFNKIKSKFDEHGGLESVIKILNGDSFPLVLIDKDHIDFTYRLVSAAKEGLI